MGNPTPRPDAPRSPSPGRAAARAEAVVVSALGMTSPVGATAGQALASIRGGLRRMAKLPALYRCRGADPRLDEPDPVAGSAITHLPAHSRDKLEPSDWLGLMAGYAFRDLAEAGRLAGLSHGRLAVVLVAPGAGLDEAAGQALTLRFHDFAEQDLLPAFQLKLGGHAVGLAALEVAVDLLGRGAADAVAVGGVDSLLFRPRLEALDAGWRLLCERNPDGFQPGEGASFVLLERASAALRRGQPALASLRASTQQQAAPHTSTADPGLALSALLEPLLDGGPAAPAVVCDLNGESWRTREWAHAQSRLGRKMGEGLAVEHPASVLGEVGAATGATLLAAAVHGLWGKHRRRPAALVWAGDDDGARRAVLLTRPGERS